MFLIRNVYHLYVLGTITWYDSIRHSGFSIFLVCLFSCSKKYFFVGPYFAFFGSLRLSWFACVLLYRDVLPIDRQYLLSFVFFL